MNQSARQAMPDKGDEPLVRCEMGVINIMAMARGVDGLVI
jgi:hypothetical protein